MGRMQVDDGAAVYLNGVELYRCYLPLAPPAPLYFELKPKGKAGAPRDMEYVRCSRGMLPLARKGYRPRGLCTASLAPSGYELLPRRGS